MEVLENSHACSPSKGTCINDTTSHIVWEKRERQRGGLSAPLEHFFSSLSSRRPSLGCIMQAMVVSGDDSCGLLGRLRKSHRPADKQVRVQKPSECLTSGNPQTPPSAEPGPHCRTLGAAQENKNEPRLGENGRRAKKKLPARCRTGSPTKPAADSLFGKRENASTLSGDFLVRHYTCKR